MKVLDLFSGIGGFSLGLERAGMETVAFCEYEEFPQKVLAKHWPDVPCYPDVRELTAEQLTSDGITDIGLICGGYPCQPFSHAGKRQGQADDRHLWPDMFRLICELRPAWVVAENVAGHINMGLDDVLFDLEGQGYTVETFVIPACAVNAYHRRDRLWIVAYPAINGSAEIGRELPKTNEQQAPQRQKGRIRKSVDAGAGRMEPKDASNAGLPESPGRHEAATNDDRCGGERKPEGSVAASSCGAVADSASGQQPSSINGSQPERGGSPTPKGAECTGGGSGKQILVDTKRIRQSGRGEPVLSSNPATSRQGQADKPVNVCFDGIGEPESSMGRGTNGLPAWLDGFEHCADPDGTGHPRVAAGIKDKTHRLKALGNAVVPQIPEIIGRAIMEVERSEEMCQ